MADNVFAIKIRVIYDDVQPLDNGDTILNRQREYYYLNHCPLNECQTEHQMVTSGDPTERDPTFYSKQAAIWKAKLVQQRLNTIRQELIQARGIYREYFVKPVLWKNINN